MIEQTVLHGRMFLTVVKGKTLASNLITPNQLEFGPMRPITIYPISSTVLFVENRTNNNLIKYENTKRVAIVDQVDLTNHQGFDYYYGLAKHTNGKGETALYPYFIQNQPKVTIDNIPNIDVFEAPQTLQALDYDQVFTFLPIIHTLLADLKATYVDRFKRPIRKINGRTYPVRIESVETTIKDLPPTTYPVAFDFKDSPYAVVDLEPDYTPDDLEHFNSLDGYYREDTPRGGKHLLVKLDDPVFKYRYSPKLEIINQTQITFYGINGEVLSHDPRPLDVSKYSHTNNNSKGLNIQRPNIPVDDAVKPYVEALKQKSKENASTSFMMAQQKIRHDLDPSHCDYMILYILYHQDVKPYTNSIPRTLRPWVLEAYAREHIEYRDKHATSRNGVPYLVHVANTIIEQVQSNTNQDNGKESNTWEDKTNTK